MSSEIVISARNLCKTYRTYAHPLDRLLPGRSGRCKAFHALRDVSFDIRGGETVGIIGRNGSGKSTLLQLVCGIRRPTSGHITVNGRISALLELGAGFHPEFTGRENVFMQGAIQGLTREDIEARFDDIAGFADIGEYIEHPVKTYSSGMFVRLAFAVAVSIDPDILVVDEALAVGDIRFQSSCFQRMKEIRDSGGTILFVTHATDRVVRMCDRTMLLDEGEKLVFGQPKLVVGMLQKLLYAPTDRKSMIRADILMTSSLLPEESIEEQDANTRYPVTGKISGEFRDPVAGYDPELKPKSTIEYESHGAFIESPELTNLDGVRVNCVITGETCRFVYAVRFERKIANVRLAMLIKTSSGVELGGATTAASVEDSIPVVHKGTRIKVVFEFKCMLNPGTYFLNAGVTGDVNGNEIIIHRLLDAEMFRVMSPGRSTSTATVDFGCKYEIQILDRPSFETSP